MPKPDPADPWNQGVRMKMNDLPESLFVNIELEEGMFGVGAKYSYVCPDHNGRRLPCRTCIYREVATTPYLELRTYRTDILFDALDSTGFSFSEFVNLEAVADYLAERNF